MAVVLGFFRVRESKAEVGRGGMSRDGCEYWPGICPRSLIGRIASGLSWYVNVLERFTSADE